MACCVLCVVFSGVLCGVGVNPSSASVCTVRSRCVLCRAGRHDVMSIGDVAVCSTVVTVHGVLCTVRGVQWCTLWRGCEP
jgi:hypothetical protein